MPKQKTVRTPGFIVACMNCHGGKGTEVDTKKEADHMAEIHLSIDGPHTSHASHVVAIIPATLVRTKKA